MMEQIKKTPEEIRANRVAAMANARAVRAAKRSEKKEDNMNEKVPTKTVYFDTEYHDYNNFVEGMKIAMKNLDIRSKNDVVKAIPVAEEFVRICQEKYPTNV